MDTAYFAYDRNKSRHALPVTRNYIVVNVNKNGERFFHEILQDVKEYIQQGYEVYFVPVSIGTSKEYSDIFYYHELKYRLKLQASSLPTAGGLKLLRREANFKHFVEKVANAEIVISTRLHLFLIASFLNVKTKVYPYQKKILKMKEVINNL